MVHSDFESSDFNMRILCPRIRLSLIFDPTKNNMNSQLQLQRNKKYSDFQSGCLSMMQYMSSF